MFFSFKYITNLNDFKNIAEPFLFSNIFAVNFLKRPEKVAVMQKK
jgi:hypothetical protein